MHHLLAFQSMLARHPTALEDDPMHKIAEDLLQVATLKGVIAFRAIISQGCSQTDWQAKLGAPSNMWISQTTVSG